MPSHPSRSGESLSAFGHERKWSDLKNLGLFPEVSSIDEYDTRFFANVASTRALMTATPNTFSFPSPDEVRAVHRGVFADIHPWAGQFRSKALGIGGRIGADHTTLVANLQLAQAETRDLLERRSWSPICAAVYYHIRFELIHPFRDGNSRVGRLMLAAQIQNLAGLHMHPPLEAREQYLDRMDHAAWCGKLGPLARLIESWCGIPPSSS